MKKIFTLFAAAALAMSANAETVVDANIDYSTWDSWNLYEMGYAPTIQDGCLVSSNPVNEETGEANAWYQYFMFPAFSASIGQTYTATFTVQGSVDGECNIQFRWSWGEDPINVTLPITTTMEEHTVIVPEVGGTNMDVIFQSGAYVGELKWSKVVITHEEKEGRPVEWIQWLVNGDAEGEYGEVPCAYTKEYGVNGNEPYPSPIESVDGSNVFVVHANPCPENTDGTEGAHAWQNQFWIQSPKAWAGGDQIKLSFRYKASKEVNTNTQCHAETPGSYLHWQAIGDITFSTEWKTYNGTFSVPDAGNGMWSIAFNLGAQVWDENIDFYFDDLSWESMKLDEGYFVAGDFNDWNLDDAVEFVWNEELGVYEAVVGTEAKGAAQIKISTVRGNDAAFDGHLLKVTGDIVDDADSWMDYVMAYQKINLPEAGIWQIWIDPEYEAMSFAKVGDAQGVEKVEETCRRIEVKAGAMAANPWDNQFWFLANRALAAGETTTITFDCKATDKASIGTQSHGEPGAYLHWAAIGNVTFDETWTTFTSTFTVADEADGMLSIALNLNDYADANTYMFRNVTWVDADGNSLIVNGDLATDDATSFIAKTNSDEATADQIVPATITGSGEPSAIETVKVETESNVIFNLSGQRVNNAKGLVIKNGKVMFVK